ncbi:MerR family transcriptional regulator [Gottfriedia acidiceleris]|uniref:MerR family transcriptional regulator n=1 Tax=Gottfriedia acidiceleris TaxID=371036 RepID=UPI002FFE92C3
MEIFSIGQFSKLSGLSIDTLRYYEKEKLIFPKRDSANRRVYSEEDFSWIDFIHRLKKTGMSIKNMREYTKLRYQGNSTVSQRLLLLDDQLEELQQKEREISEHIQFVENKIEIYHQMLGENINKESTR